MPTSARPLRRLLGDWIRALAELWWMFVCVPPLLAALSADPDEGIGWLDLYGFYFAASVAFAGSLTALYTALWERAPAGLREGPAGFVVHLLLILAGVALGIELLAWVVPALQLPAPDPLRPNLWRLAPFIVAGLTLLVLVIEHLRAEARAQAERAERAGREVLGARLEALQARTDPHFLFNSLNTVAALIAEDPERAEDAVERLSDLFRYALDAGRRDRVPLRVELDAIADYVELQRLRFEERLDAALDIALAPAELDRIAVPPLILQPLVENAIKHGLADRALRVRVEARREGDDLILSVTDDGRGFGHTRARGAGTGMQTLRDRLALLYGPEAELSIDTVSGAGSRVAIRLPHPERQTPRSTEEAPR